MTFSLDPVLSLVSFLPPLPINGGYPEDVANIRRPHRGIYGRDCIVLPQKNSLLIFGPHPGNS